MFSQIDPMLIAKRMAPFNDPGWIFELKLDGCRCIAYLSDHTSLKNKRNIEMIQKFPELKNLNQFITDPVILDGELVVLKDGIPDFYELQRRTLLNDSFKIQLAAARLPASFVAYDCLWFKDKSILTQQQLQRKEYLRKVVQGEDERFAVSRFIENNGIGLYQLTEEQKLEGVVAKKKDSLYFPGKRSNEWIKFKRMEDEDFVVAGYIKKAQNTYSIILGKYQNGILLYRGHVTSGVTRYSIEELVPQEKSTISIFPIGSGNEHANWVIPDHVCVVEYMPNTKNALRQPVFKGFRTDVDPKSVQQEKE